MVFCRRWLAVSLPGSRYTVGTGVRFGFFGWLEWFFSSPLRDRYSLPLFFMGFLPSAGLLRSVCYPFPALGLNFFGSGACFCSGSLGSTLTFFRALVVRGAVLYTLVYTPCLGIVRLGPVVYSHCVLVSELVVT